METIYLKGQQLNFDEAICSAIGFFDGLHIGHMALVNKVLSVSKKMGYKSALMTFDHHPLFVLGRVQEEKYLTSMKDRQEILEKLGIDYLFVIEFTKEVAALSPQDFICKYLIQNHIQHVVCGFDFRFGNHNIGDVQTLQSCTSFQTSVIHEILYKNEKISSSRIRQCLDEGHIEEINALLGRRYCIKGTVVQGRQIGHTIGFPTANVDYQSYFLPHNGVYAVKVYVHHKWYMGMCNIGYNPTFTALKKQSLEVYILDFYENIYGEEMIVEFYTMTRLEKTFSSKDELVNQLNQDQQDIREYLQTQD